MRFKYFFNKSIPVPIPVSMEKAKKALKYKDQPLTFEKVLNDKKETYYILKLYVTGSTPQSARAIDNIRKVCEEHLKAQYSLEVIDLYKQPSLAAGEQIIAAPTLVKQLPLPLRRILGDLSNTEKVLVGLDLKKAETPMTKKD
jgi:circadian clock protein KaiB